MATIKKFEDLDIWKLARELSKEVYQLSIKGTFAKDFELRDHINRTAGSVMDNIAEGFERDGNKEFRQFLSVSKGSCGEVRSQSYRALDRGHQTENEQVRLAALTDDLGRKIANLMSYLNSSEYTGIKFKQN